MEALYKNVLQNNGKNTVDEIMRWLTNAKLANTQEQQKKVQTVLTSAANNGKVEFAKFQEVVVNCAKEQKISSEAATKQLTEAAGQAVTENVQAAVGNAASAAKNALGRFGI